jgi:serine/threonine protein kinase
LELIENLHKAGIIHCDLKPENIMTEKDTNLNYSNINAILNIPNPFKLIDFGLSQKYKDEVGNHIKIDKAY